MKKYFTLFKTYLQKYIYYRANAFIWAIFDISHFVILIIVWGAIYRTNTTVAGINYSQMVSYYLILSIIRELVYAAGGRNMIAEEIYHGQLNIYLIKPISYLKRVFIEEISWRLIQTALFFIPFTVLFLLVNKHVGITTTAVLSPLSIIALVFAFIISAFIDYLCALAGFWITQTSTLFHLKEIAFGLLGGLAFPTKLLPGVIQNINFGLPFYYIFSFPIEVINQQLTINQIAWRLIVQIIWIGLLMKFYQFIWRKGTKEYNAWGN